MTKSVRETLAQLDEIIREHLNPLGFVDYNHGAYQTGHVPHVAPQAYLCIRYPGLSDDGIKAAEAECGRYISNPYRELLSHMNGARMLGVTLYGSIGGSVDRSGMGIGQPISLWYQNAVERPDYIPEGHLGIGGINGEWFSQGDLYLASTGEVELYNAVFDIIGAKWNSLAEFLEVEIPRRFSLYDAEGRQIKGAKLLPGDTEEWEHLAKAAKEQKTGSSRLARFLRPFRRK